MENSELNKISDMLRKNGSLMDSVTESIANITRANSLLMSPISDSIANIGKINASLLSPISDSIANITRANRLLMSPISDSIANIGKINASLISPISDSIANITRANRLLMSPISDSIANIGKINATLMSPISESFANIAKINDSLMSPITDSIANITRANRLLTSPISDSFANIAKINMNGLTKLDSLLTSLPISMSTIEGHQINDAQALELKPFFDSIDFSHPKKLWDWAIQTILNAKAKLESKNISAKTFAFVVCLVWWLVDNLCFTVPYNYLMGEPAQVNNYYETNIVVNQSHPELLDSPVKIVRNNLHVHRKSRGKSKVIGYLLEGDLVEVLDRRNHWRYVVWTDGDLSVEGWVKAKYLRKPKPLSKHFKRKSAEDEMGLKTKWAEDEMGLVQ